MIQALRLHRRDSDSRFDWGTHASDGDESAAEVERRTFWCAFCLDRLLANGRDRNASFSVRDITTRLPMSDGDFIFGLKSTSKRLNESSSGDTVLGYTIRILATVENVISWHGQGGRHVDNRAPWLSTMPFSKLDKSLDDWELNLPSHLKYNRKNLLAVKSLGQGELWGLMHMMFSFGRVYLHREYLPFIYTHGHDPSLGPCDGPVLDSQNVPAPDGWWSNSLESLIKCADLVCTIFEDMVADRIPNNSYPFPGLCLMTAATVHIMFASAKLETSPSMDQARHKAFLKRDLIAIRDLKNQWNLASHWVTAQTSNEDYIEY
jgi:hypothetical protein